MDSSSQTSTEHLAQRRGCGGRFSFREDCVECVEEDRGSDGTGGGESRRVELMDVLLNVVRQFTKLVRTRTYTLPDVLQYVLVSFVSALIIVLLVPAHMATLMLFMMLLVVLTMRELSKYVQTSNAATSPLPPRSASPTTSGPKVPGASGGGGTVSDRVRLMRQRLAARESVVKTSPPESGVVAAAPGAETAL